MFCIAGVGTESTTSKQGLLLLRLSDKVDSAPWGSGVEKAEGKEGRAGLQSQGRVSAAAVPAVLCFESRAVPLHQCGLGWGVCPARKSSVRHTARWDRKHSLPWGCDRVCALGFVGLGFLFFSYLLLDCSSPTLPQLISKQFPALWIREFCWKSRSEVTMFCLDWLLWKY